MTTVINEKLVTAEIYSQKKLTCKYFII